uniref:ATP synthase complex subunit 8 n=1 Tax=Pseudhymenochirus merlini TaxID=864177 RepID=F6KDA9_9PIPI|nr:ATP synthase F0 subunit 8 [Pseudhymenochirus merlini]ADM35700.1 ATP synthase F0 subunit 8 [Pseudhymenochirus merlini]
MPQLNPGPWFLLFVFSWLVLLTIIPPKVSNYQNTNEATTQNTEKQSPQPWSWPWS